MVISCAEFGFCVQISALSQTGALQGSAHKGPGFFGSFGAYFHPHSVYNSQGVQYELGILVEDFLFAEY